MQNCWAYWGVFCLSLLTTGCIYTDRSEEYLKSGSLVSVSLPDGVESKPLEPLYPIPEVTPRLDTFLVTDLGGDGVPRPDAMSAERQAAAVKIQKVSGRQWLLIDAPPSQVWPLAQSFLSKSGINVVRSDAASGLIQTDWVEFKLDEATKTHYQIRIEKGVRPESTEIHILQDQIPVSAKAPTSWPKRSTDAEREFWLLEIMANDLALGINNKAASLLGQSVGGQSKAQLTMYQNEPALHLHLDKARAWATLAHAATKEGFIRWDEDDVQNVFYLQYTGDYKRPNWFVRLFTWGSGAPVTSAPHSMTMALGHLRDTPDVRAFMGHLRDADFKGPLANGAGYFLVLSQVPDGFIVRVRDYRGAELPAQKNKKLLALLRRNLI